MSQSPVQDARANLTEKQSALNTGKLNQGRLKIWMEHSTLILLNLASLHINLEVRFSCIITGAIDLGLH